jgi:hypothetical protein
VHFRFLAKWSYHLARSCTRLREPGRRVNGNHQIYRCKHESPIQRPCGAFSARSAAGAAGAAPSSRARSLLRAHHRGEIGGPQCMVAHAESTVVGGLPGGDVVIGQETGRRSLPSARQLPAVLGSVSHSQRWHARRMCAPLGAAFNLASKSSGVRRSNRASMTSRFTPSWRRANSRCPTSVPSMATPQGRSTRSAESTGRLTEPLICAGFASGRTTRQSRLMSCA